MYVKFPDLQYVKDNTVYLYVITFLVSTGPGPALVDAVIAQLY